MLKSTPARKSTPPLVVTYMSYGEDEMMILTIFNVLDDLSTSLVHDPKLDHLYDEDEIMTIDLCQVRRSPRSRLGTRTRSSGSQKRRQSSRRLSAWRPILEWPKISSFSLVGSFFVRFADIDDSFQSKVMVWVCQQWQLPGYSRGSNVNSIRFHPKGSLSAHTELRLLPLSGKKRGMMVIGQSWPGRRFHMSV